MAKAETKLEAREIPEGFVIDVESWVMEQHFEWDRALNNADRDSQNALMASAIKSWPYQYDPKDPDVYVKKLKPKQWKASVMAVANACFNCFLD